MSNPNIVVRVHSEAQMKRIMECSERFNVSVYFSDTIPEKLLPRELKFLGYVFVSGPEKDLVSFSKYATEIDLLANEWQVPVKE